MNKKITLPELVDALSETTGMQKKICESFVKDLIDVLQTSLLNNENVKIAGLGTFKCVEVDARKSVDVNSGEEIEIPSYRKVVLSVDKTMAQAVNAAFAEFETVEIDDSISDEMLYENDADSKEEAVSEKPLVADTQGNDNTPVSEESEEIESIEAEEAENYEPEPMIPQAESAAQTIEISETPKAGVSVEQETETQIQAKNITAQQETKETEQNLNIQNRAEIQEPIIEQENECGHKAFKRGIIWGVIAGFVIALIIMLGALLYMGDRISIFNDNNQDVAENVINCSDQYPNDTNENIDSVQESINLPVEEERSVMTDTVGRTRFLTTMAREYYGNFNFWVYIYLENKDVIDNPNKIKPGTVVTIPDAKKYDIDSSDNESIAKAQKLAAEINSQFD